MNSIISYLLLYNQYLLQIISYLCNFICRFIPLKQFAFDDSKSPKYQKLKIDKLPIILESVKQDYTFLIEYYRKRYGKTITPVKRRNGKVVPESVVCPFCGAPHEFIYDNNGGNGQYLCKVCQRTFHDNDKDISNLHLLCCP